MRMILCAVVITLFALQAHLPGAEFHVSPAGDDSAAGTAAAPFRSISQARDMLRQNHERGGKVVLHGGTYYLNEPLVLTPEDAGEYAAAAGEKVVISGGRKLELKWSAFKDGILQAPVPGVKEGKVDFDQLFVDGDLQHLARYPNFDPKVEHYNGVAADCLSPKRIAKWAHPETAILHALHGNEWGDLHYRVTGIDAKGNAILAGGWQNNRGSGPHATIRFVENVFEELDAPGEWFLDKSAGVLYFLPPAGVDVSKATIEAAGLKHLIEFRGSAEKPVTGVTFSNITFTHAGRTFLEKYEPLLRTDWSIYRGGAIVLDGTEKVSFTDCNFVNLGGNAVFFNGFNRNDSIAGCKFENIGASAACFVGLTSAVRSPASWQHGTDWATVERTPGPKTQDYPADCKISDCLIHHFGTIEKQVAGVEIDMAERITVDHCSIYDCPRAGINIGDGCWGGHIVENCDIFDTVKETGDHGSFNSWGRDRFWQIKPPAGKSFDDLVKENPTLPEWDVIEPITLRNNRWRCDHGWDIDLDDGSSNYHIFNNLCLHGGLKNREGFDRIVRNNIMINNTFHPHVWFKVNRGVFEHNIVAEAYRPIGVGQWDADVNHNFFLHEKDLKTAQNTLHGDADSAAGDPMFIDPAHGDYRVKDESPALKVGFKNFAMDQFGVISPRLKAEAKTPVLPAALSAVRPGVAANVEIVTRNWLGGKIRNVTGLGDRSAFGLPGETGVIVVGAPAGSQIKALGLEKNDVIIKLNDKVVNTAEALIVEQTKAKEGAPLKFGIIRSQKEMEI